MKELPDPPVLAEVDLQDFPFMPLQVGRLRDSDFAASVHPEAAWYGVLLWAASWHQIPAGSLPDNDTMLMRFVGLGRDIKTWKKHRAGALYGFILCKDGRLYHPTVVEQANEAWFGKLQQRHRTFCAAVRKHNERNPDKKIESPTFDEWDQLGRPDRVAQLVTEMSRVTDVNVACDNGSKRQGQGQGQGQGDSIEEDKSSLSSPAANDDPQQDEFELVGEDGTPPPAKPELTPEHIRDAWNDLAQRCGLPEVVKLSEERRKACRARIAEYEIGDFRKALAAIERSDFLRNGNGTWRGANFDFFLQKSSFLKLIEGQYDQKPAAL